MLLFDGRRKEGGRVKDTQQDPPPFVNFIHGYQNTDCLSFSLPNNYVVSSIIQTPREKQTLPVFVPAAAADGTWRLMLPVKRLENEALMIHVLKSNVLRISTLPACEH